jgi:adenosine deaminase
MFGRMDRLERRPIRKFYDAGVKVTVNIDDALAFGRSVSEEFLGLYRAEVFDAVELGRNPAQWTSRLANPAWLRVSLRPSCTAGI